MNFRELYTCKLIIVNQIFREVKESVKKVISLGTEKKKKKGLGIGIIPSIGLGRDPQKGSTIPGLRQATLRSLE